MSLHIRVQDRIAWVTLDRPDAMNAIDPPMRQAIRAMWGDIDRDNAVDVAVITGAGDHAFCAGSDLKRTPPGPESFAQETFGDDANDTLVPAPGPAKPWICAFNGAAYGGGLEIGLACDLRIASETARFALAEVRVGTLPGSGGTQRLPRMVGHANAMWMLLTGDPVDAAQALRMGLVSHVVPPDRLTGLAMELARRIADNAPLAVRAAKKLVRQGQDMPLDAALVHERYAWGILRDTEDRLEGRRAFAEKRPPRYRGR